MSKKDTTPYGVKKCLNFNIVEAENGFLLQSKFSVLAKRQVGEDTFRPEWADAQNVQIFNTIEDVAKFVTEQLKVDARKAPKKKKVKK